MAVNDFQTPHKPPPSFFAFRISHFDLVGWGPTAPSYAISSRTTSAPGYHVAMFLRLALLFTIVPLVELYLLIEVGRIIGVQATIAIVVLTGLLGAWLARVQGLRVLGQVQASLKAGQLPTDAIVDGLLILIAAAVLLTPGLITDSVGFLLLIPAGRKMVRKVVRKSIVGQRPADPVPDVIDVEWRREDPGDSSN